MNIHSSKSKLNSSQETLYNKKVSLKNNDTISPRVSYKSNEDISIRSSKKLNENSPRLSRSKKSLSDTTLYSIGDSERNRVTLYMPDISDIIDSYNYNETNDLSEKDFKKIDKNVFNDIEETKKSEYNEYKTQYKERNSEFLIMKREIKNFDSLILRIDGQIEDKQIRHKELFDLYFNIENSMLPRKSRSSSSVSGNSIKKLFKSSNTDDRMMIKSPLKSPLKSPTTDSLSSSRSSSSVSNHKGIMKLFKSPTEKNDRMVLKSPTGNSLLSPISQNSVFSFLSRTPSREYNDELTAEMIKNREDAKNIYKDAIDINLKEIYILEADKIKLVEKRLPFLIKESELEQELYYLYKTLQLLEEDIKLFNPKTKFRFFRKN